jgi:hypothetical protein
MWIIASRWRGHDVKLTRMLVRGVQERVPCAGMRVRWILRADSVMLSVPADCPRGGHYGKVRGFLLTESGPSGADSDYAPETSSGEPSSWITRG